MLEVSTEQPAGRAQFSKLTRAAGCRCLPHPIHYCVHSNLTWQETAEAAEGTDKDGLGVHAWGGDVLHDGVQQGCHAGSPGGRLEPPRGDLPCGPALCPGTVLTATCHRQGSEAPLEGLWAQLLLAALNPRPETGNPGP